MDNNQNESKDEEETIVNNELTESNIFEGDYDTKSKIISFITEYMSLSLKDKIEKYLINKSIISIKNPITSDTLFHYLCINDENYILIKLINPNSLQREQKNNLGQTLLHIAVKNKSYKILKFLLENGSNIHSKDNNNNTVLHIAMKNGDLNIIQLLLKYNPKIDILNNDNESPIDIAKKMNNIEILSYLNFLKNDKINNNKKFKENAVLNRLKKSENFSKGKNMDKNSKSILNNISMNNCSLDTKNETDSQSFNIYKKKIISKESNIFNGRKIRPNKTINLNVSVNDNTPIKKFSYNSMNRLSPLYNAKLIYRKTSPKLIHNQGTLIEFENDSEIYEYNPRIKYLSPKMRKIDNSSILNIKKQSNNDIINEESNLYDINYYNIKNKNNNFKKYNNIKYHSNNSLLPKSLYGCDNPNCKIKEVRKAPIHKSPFSSFVKNQKNEDICKQKLLQFLKEIGMQEYGKILISEGFDDINLIIKQMKEGFPLLDDTLKEIGIIPAGDRAKIIIRLQQISNGFDFDFPFEQVYFKDNGSILKWLEKERLSKYNKNFLDVGYQSFELLLIQMASKYKINDNILKNDIYIFNEEERIKILKSLKINSEKYIKELKKKKNIQRTYSKMVNSNNESICIII